MFKRGRRWIANYETGFVLGIISAAGYSFAHLHFALAKEGEGGWRNPTPLCSSFTDLVHVSFEYNSFGLRPIHRTISPRKLEFSGGNSGGSWKGGGGKVRDEGSLRREQMKFDSACSIWLIKLESLGERKGRLSIVATKRMQHLTPSLT